jgi:hypothetical protein
MASHLMVDYIPVGTFEEGSLSIMVILSICILFWCLPDTGQRSNQGNVGYYSIDYLVEDLSWTSDGPSR